MPWFISDTYHEARYYLWTRAALFINHSRPFFVLDRISLLSHPSLSIVPPADQVSTTMQASRLFGNLYIQPLFKKLVPSQLHIIMFFLYSFWAFFFCFNLLELFSSNVLRLSRAHPCNYFFTFQLLPFPSPFFSSTGRLFFDCFIAGVPTTTESLIWSLRHHPTTVQPVQPLIHSLHYYHGPFPIPIASYLYLFTPCFTIRSRLDNLASFFSICSISGFLIVEACLLSLIFFFCSGFTFLFAWPPPCF